MPKASFEKSIETKNNIVDAAYRLFLEHGYNAAPMREIARRADVTVGAIYNHFASKEEIWKEVLDTRHPYHEFIPVLQQVRGENAAELVHCMAYELNRELLKRPDLLNLMFIEIVEFNGKHLPELFTKIMPDVFKLGSLFTKTSSKLQNFPLPVLVRSFIGLFFSYYITGLFTREVEEFTNDDETLKQMADLYLLGILADDDPLRKQLQM
jgi:AcrR family transcriptional regulator